MRAIPADKLTKDRRERFSDMVKLPVKGMIHQQRDYGYNRCMSAASQTFIPMLSYVDGEAMMDWLIAAFGFQQKERWVEEGRLTHGELTFDNGVIMIANPTPLYQSPKQVRAAYEPAAKWSELPYVMNGVLVHVQDIDAHFAKAVEAGAVILSPVESATPGRIYKAEDPEGQRWFFLEAN